MMTMPSSVALCFSALFILNMAQLPTSSPSSLRIVSASVGESVVLPCLCQGNKKHLLYWYKQPPGQMPTLMSTKDTFKNRTRFSLDTEKKTLTISNLEISDSATYLCAKGTSIDFMFCEGVTVSVEGSGVNVQTLVHQASSENIQPGGSGTLSCTVHTGTCDGEHSVYWFKNSEEHQPGLLYTHGDKRDQCERKPDTQTHTCVYNLSLRSLNHSDTGTYYCAVASCGHILFGKRSTEDFKAGNVTSHLLGAALAFTTVLDILLAAVLCRIHRGNWPSAATSSPDAERLHQDAENLHYATFRGYAFNRAGGQGEDTVKDCVYSGVRQ